MSTDLADIPDELAARLRTYGTTLRAAINDDLDRTRDNSEVPPATGRSFRIKILVGAGAALAIAATIIAVTVPAKNSKPTYAANIVAVAEANDRLLVGQPGWHVTRADEFAVDQGEVAFSDGSHELEVRWVPAADYQGYLDDRNAGDTNRGPIVVLGRRGTLFSFGETNFTTLIEPDNSRHYVELVGNTDNEDAYRQLLASLKSVDVNTWLSAMPANVVKPAERSAAIDEMLAGIPIPAGFDRSALDATGTVSDRYQLGAKVTSAVACVWFDQWFTATERGDTEMAKAASDALVSSHNWPILNEMASRSDWPKVLWLLADETTNGGNPTELGVVKLSRDNLASGIGCSEWWATPLSTTP
jgi:hypothetical protein